MLAAAGLGKLGSCEWFDPRKRSKEGVHVEKCVVDRATS